MDLKHFIIPPNKKFLLKNYLTNFTGHFNKKENAQKKLEEDIARLAELQDLLYAQDNYALLIIFQAMDTAGKDGAIKHIMSGVNPQGVQVYSFKEPSAEELDHDYLWRSMKALPGRGRIGIFNRSYYEEVLVTRVRPEILSKQKLPPESNKRNIWKQRFEDINHMERYLVRNGVILLKFFLHISKKEQKERLLGRINDSEKNWKFSASDLENRKYWNRYMKAYQDMMNHTSTEWAPWHIIPSDHKWFARVAVANVIISKMESLHLRYPKVSKEEESNLLKYKKTLKRQ